MSFGVYTVAGASVHTVNAAVRAADQALYAAKEKGRNRVEVWRADLVENVRQNCTVA
jgi:PleD family two-component response regulator